MAPNVPEYAIVFHGVAVAGGTVTTINPTYGADEVRFQLQDAGASMLITIGMFAETAKAAIEGTDVPEVLTLDGAAPATRWRCWASRSSRCRSTSTRRSSCSPTRRARRDCRKG